ncbi:hypothetical protein B0H67DRAFT_633064 [Lasiosphaeris hirsuta]|uniref:Nudix hydrolase domain-containing protein n=1 Tax=Lasiosphaeris hirsuta TaxID=260670 RepID=A0AA40DZG4_9PEZI|nr:hypothetical protein B0H67DRAFT_633064 [Lasiosphaeris hirsuta]
MASTDSASINLADAVDQQILNSSRQQFREQQLSPNGQLYDKVVFVAATLRYDVSRNPTILLLKRATHEVYFPNYALIREVKEETGLDVTGITAELKPMIYKTEKTVANDAGQEVLVSKSSIQLNYVVTVLDGDVTLSADEHSESAWATNKESVGLNITSAMKEVIWEAFAWAAGQTIV